MRVCEEITLWICQREFHGCPCFGVNGTHSSPTVLIYGQRVWESKKTERMSYGRDPKYGYRNQLQLATQWPYAWSFENRDKPCKWLWSCKVKAALPFTKSSWMRDMAVVIRASAIQIQRQRGKTYGIVLCQCLLRQCGRGIHNIHNIHL